MHAMWKAQQEHVDVISGWVAKEVVSVAKFEKMERHTLEVTICNEWWARGEHAGAVS